MSSVGFQGEDITTTAGAAYCETEVCFMSADGTSLYGVLRTPTRGSTPIPAVLLLPGGAPVDRNGNPSATLSLSHVRGVQLNVLRELAEALSDAGIASFRYDKRGVGASGGDFLRRTAIELIDDAEAALELLRTVPSIGKVVAFGHSEGGLIAPQLCARGHEVAGVVFAASTGLGLMSVAKHQFAGAAARAVAQGLSPTDAWEDFALLQQQVADGTDLVAYGKDGLESGEWFRSWADLDVPGTLLKVQCPALVIHGDRDYQVPWTESLRIVQQLRQAGNADVTLNLFSNVDHLLKFEPEWSAPERYQQVDRPMEPLVARSLVAWTRRVVGLGDRPALGDPWQGFSTGFEDGTWQVRDAAMPVRT